jgi:hypothetical protein
MLDFVLGFRVIVRVRLRVSVRVGMKVVCIEEQSWDEGGMYRGTDLIGETLKRMLRLHTATAPSGWQHFHAIHAASSSL